MRTRHVLFRHFSRTLRCAVLLVVCTNTVLRAQAPVFTPTHRHGVVASEAPLASKVGLAILKKGGNAVDAAVATAFALAVTHPTAGNIGGGGFLVVREANGEAHAFDFREKAPLAASQDMFLNERGEYDRDLHHWSILSVGVPGSVAGLYLAHSQLGKLPWRDLVDPAVRLARDGFAIAPSLAESIKEAIEDFRKYPAALAQFSRGGTLYKSGEQLVQADLATTLERIRDRGRDGFYTGETADLIVAGMRQLGGIITHADLAQYQPTVRPPIRGTYRGYEVLGMHPPSSGGVAVVEMLNIIEGYDLRSMGPRSAAATHVMVEAMRRAYADRARFVGDPDHVEVPIARLTAKEHAEALRTTIAKRRASRSSPSSFEWPAESSETTHLSVVDKERMGVALTTTLERPFGCRIVLPGTGFLLNNEMGDFNPQPGRTTSTGQIGTKANLVAPAKRMLSSMSPTIVVRGGKLRLVVGSPGGRTIINSVLQVITNVVDFEMTIQEAVDAPRFHHQWLPDEVVAERWCFSADSRRALEKMGHRICNRNGSQGSVMAIEVGDDGALRAGVDRRRGAALGAGY